MSLIISIRKFLTLFMIMPKNYQVIKRKVKYLRLEISEGKLRFIIPKNYYRSIKDLIEVKKLWLEKKMKILKEIKEMAKNINLKKQKNLLKIIVQQIEKLSFVLKVKPKRISFRLMKRRWASCSASGEIIFNKLLKFLPKSLINYVVSHEMCHLLIKNHKKDFWLLVKKIEPDFLEKEKMLAVYKRKIDKIKFTNSIQK